MIKNIIIISIIMLLGLSSVFIAQDRYTISGYVKDAENGEELIGVNIFIKGTTVGTTTNSYGFYSLTTSDRNFTIVFSYIGYQSKEERISLNENVTLDVELELTSIETGEVEVVAEAPDVNINSVEMSTAQLDINTIKTTPVVLGEVDVLKTIQLLPGITSARDGANGFNVRGGASDQNLVLLDEATIYNSAHLFGFFSVFNGDVVKDSKIYKGGIPSKYGGRLSSVLDVRQRDGNNKKFEVNGGIGLISSRLSVEGPIVKDKSSFIIAARRSYADIFLKLADQDNMAYFYDVNFKGNYIFDKSNKMYLSGYFGRDGFEFGNLFSNTWGNAALNLRWNHLFSEKLFSNTSLIYSDYDYVFDIIGTGADLRREAHVISFKIKSDFSYFINEANILDFGFNAISYDFQPGKVTPLNGSNVNAVELDRKSAIESAVYLSYEQKLGEALSLKYGLRFSQFWRLGDQVINQYRNDMPVVYNERLGRYEDGEVTGTVNYDNWDTIDFFYALEPRFSARFKLNPQSSVKLSYNRTVQYIHLIANSATASPFDVWAPSGNHINPQKADQVALGYFRNFNNNEFEFSAEVYYKWIQDRLDYVDGAQLLTNNNIETELLSGSGRSYGLELFFRKTMGRLTGWLSYTWSKAEQRVAGISANDPGINNGIYYPTNFDKTHDVSLTLMYEFSQKLTLSTNFIFATGTPITYPVSRYQFAGVVIPQYEGRNQQRIDSYHRLDFSATIKDFWGGDWVIGIYNIYNNFNAYSIVFRQNEDNPAQTEAVKTSLYGLVPSITYNFSL